jgi:hypothetical protein
MKSFLIPFFLVLSIFNIEMLFSNNNSINKVRNLTYFENCLQTNKYAVTGRTRNQFGQNYTISLRVTGSSSQFGSYISQVEYNDGNNWVRTQYYSVFGQSGVYYVSVNYQTYYFEF